MAATEHYVGDDEAGQRLDNFLFKVFKGVPHSRIYRAIRKGEVRINGARCQAESRLLSQDKVRLPPLMPPTISTTVNVPPAVLAQLPETILYEDDDLLVINKPPGLGSQGGTDIPYSVIDCFQALSPSYASLALVHRLDKATSGCLLLAKNRMACVQMQKNWQAGAVEKTYWAIVEGQWQGDERVVTDKLARRDAKTGPKVVVDNETGKSAITEFAPLEIYPTYSIITAKLLTGRMHQIRCHAASLGHPIWGDDKYGNFSLNRKLATQGLNRLCLHAWKMAFQHPKSGAPVAITAEIDKKMYEIAQAYS